MFIITVIITTVDGLSDNSVDHQAVTQHRRRSDRYDGDDEL